MAPVLASRAVRRPRTPILPAGDAAVDDAVVVEWRAGNRIAIFVLLNRDLPHHLPSLHIQGHDGGVELPENSSPSPIARPRLARPQQRARFPATPDQCSQRIPPVLAFNAKTSSLPVMTYMMPSLTSGDASKEYFASNPEPLRRVIQAPLSRLTLEALICARVE